MTDTCSQPSHWLVAEYDAARVRSLADATGLSTITAGVLVARGVDSPDLVRAFLNPSLRDQWVDTAAIPGMGAVAERVVQAVRASERIVVFGDFDLDGISSAALAALGLRALGGTVEATVPHRFREGYGLTDASMRRLETMTPDLVVTVDCGISSGSEIEWLRARGIDVVVTDHHEPGEGMLTGVPVANPKLAVGSPPLSGAGVALALVRAVGELMGDRDAWLELTDLAMLGTIADIVPLTGANRALVSDGLLRCRTRPRVGVAALASVAGLSIDRLESEQVAYGLAPRLNAAGRMADPLLSLELLSTDDRRCAEELARALDEHNRLRQAAEGDLLDAALAQAESRYVEGDRVLVLSGEGWHEGVRGIVASRLVTRFGIPVLLFSVDDDEAQGSGRSVEGVDLHAAVSTLSSLFTRYGGHAAAVGVTMPTASLSTFAAGLADCLAALGAEAFQSKLAIDAEVPLDAVSRELAAELSLLGPFGFGNPRPLLASRGVFMTARKRVGKNANHLRFTAYDGASSVPTIAFRCQDIEAFAENDAAVDIAFELELDEWQGRERIQLLARDLRLRSAPADAPAAPLVEDLFEHAEEILAAGEYAGIGDAERFHTKLAGVTFEGRQEVVARLQPGVPLRLERQPENPHDPMACAVFDPFGDQVGFFNRRLAAALAPVLDNGVEYDVEVTDVTGGVDGASLGVNVLVARRSEGSDDTEAVQLAQQRRRELAALEQDALTDALVRHLIGNRSLHRAQAAALVNLADGRSTLAVMATGRGKSLVFHVHAAREAIARDRASLFVFPLRALVADQAFHLEELLAEVGVTVRTVTGESSSREREEAFSGLGDGALDVVLTTPEFLDHHAAEFARSGRVGFVVIDEAHHVGLARAGHRPAYSRLARTLAELGGPTVLATTATAPDDIANAVQDVLGVADVVADPTVRENLHVEDHRGTPDKAGYVATLCARGEKTIVYVNSRDTSVSVARKLRTCVPDLLHRVVFYNAGMSRESRHAVERAFRDGELSVVVATSAFGEGVNIPDVRHVVLYHLPMGEVAFNQVCGRGGRDGRDARVHLVFGPADARLNELILAALAPSREDLATLYLVLRDIERQTGSDIETTNAELAERVKRRQPRATLTDKGVSTGLGVFRELGLLRSEGTGSYRRLTLLPAPEEKLDLAASVRYSEGLDELEDFAAFKERALRAPSDELLHAFNRPILPAQRPRGPS